MSPRRVRGAVLLLTLALVFGPASAANAAVQQGSGYRFIWTRCSWGQTWVNNEWASPFLESVATIDAAVGANPCENHTWKTTPGEGLAVRQELIAWDSLHNAEFLCNVGQWQVWSGDRDGATHEFWTWWAFNRPCGANNWYKGRGYAGIWVGGMWQGINKPGIDTGGDANGWVFVR